MRFKKFSLPIILILVAINSCLAFTAQGSDEKPAFEISDLSYDNTKQVFSLIDDAGSMHTVLGVSYPSWVYCKSMKDQTCNPLTAKSGEGGIIGESVVAYCMSNIQENCVEKIEISRDGKSYSTLEFEKYIPDGIYENHIAEDPQYNLPAGGAPAVFVEKINGIVQEKKYLVIFDYNTNFDPTIQKFSVVAIRLAIKPFKEINSEQWNSLWFGEGHSGISYDFDPGVTMRATVHMTNTVNGWFKGRLKSPIVSISKLTDKNNRVVIAGEPVQVPNFAYVKAKNEVTNDESQWLSKGGLQKGVLILEPSNKEAFNYIDFFRDRVKDQIIATTSQWNFISTNWESDNPCLHDSSQMLGIVNTNSMVYLGNVPEFKDGFLNYKVAGMHFQTDGITPVTGTYDLLIRSDAARCLYGFSNAPVYASISIAGASGVQEIATTVVNESDGWMHLSAKGFTFSDKTIKIKLSQGQSTVSATPSAAPSATSTPIPVATPSATPIKTSQKTPNKTIYCIKGKILKKIVGINPKCPSGYLKK